VKTIKVAYLARKPATLSYLEAAAVSVVGITAHQTLVDELKLKPNESFLSPAVPVVSADSPCKLLH